MSTLYSGKPIEGSTVFTIERAAQGYRLNKLASSLTEPENREAFLADEDAYMERFGFTEDEKAMVRARDWEAMIAHGGSIYLLLKIAGTVGSNLIEMGCQMRGERVEDFMASRPGTEAKPRRD